MRRQTTILAAVLAAGITIAGCGSDEEPTQEETSTEEATEESPEETGEESESAAQSTEPTDEATASEPAQSDAASDAESPGAEESPAPMDDPSASAGGQASLSEEEAALAEELEPLALTQEEIGNGAQAGQTAYIPQAQGQPLSLNLTGVTPEGECANALDALNGSGIVPDGSAFTQATLQSTQQLQVGVVRLSDVQAAGDSLGAVADACSTIENENVTATFTPLDEVNGVIVQIQDATAAAELAMAIEPVTDDLAAVTLLISQDGTPIEEPAVNEITAAQVEKISTEASTE